MMKKVFALLGAVLLSMSAFAGTPTAVKDSSGAEAFGTAGVVAVWKDTTYGNRVVVDYGSGAKYATDNASWSVYAKFVGGLVIPVADPSSTIGLVVDAAKSNGQQCSGGTTSRVSFPNRGQPIEASGCGLVTAVIAAGQ